MLIGLTGEAGSGKDAVFGCIAKVDSRAERRAFADPLKVSAARALGFDGSTEECVAFCNEVKQPGVSVTVAEPGRLLRTVTGREYLQRYGTEAHRDVFGMDFWIDVTCPLGFDHSGRVVLITDVRFDNEAQRVHDCGGVLWNVYRPSVSRIAESAHASESGVMGEYIDYVIDNSGSLEDLQETVETAFEHAKDL